MTEIKGVSVQLQRPTGPDDVGRITEGFYTVSGNVLTMTYADGSPVEGFTFTLKPDDDAESIARVLTRKVRRQVLGLTEEGEAFNRQISYANTGIA